MDRMVFESVIYGVSIMNIAKFLNPKDILNVCRAYRGRIKYSLYPYYKEAIMRDIDNWFKVYYKSKYDQFKKAMIADKAVISGSFIIQLMLGERWKNADIDIFISVEDFIANRDSGDNYNRGIKYYTNVERFIYNEQNMTQDKRVELILQNPWNNGNKYIDALGVANSVFHGKGLEAISRIRNYYIDPVRDSEFKYFQIIELYRTADVLGFIDSTFDFDICKNTFYYDESGMHLNILNVNDIINRRAGFKPCANLESSLKRCRKYMARGFKFFDDTDSATHKHPNVREAFINIGHQ